MEKLARKLEKYGEVLSCKKGHDDVVIIIIKVGTPLSFGIPLENMVSITEEITKAIPKHSLMSEFIMERGMLILVLTKPIS